MKDEMSAEHKFGGAWTELKLSVLEKYLHAYTTALKGKFKLLYVDAFAGSGRFVPKSGGASREGSASLALRTSGFDAYVFFERNKDRVEQLQALCRNEYPDRNVFIEQGDANDLIESYLQRFPKRDWRYMIFLDPYGMTAKWDTVDCIAKTESADLWYLFPISAVCRNSARRLSCMDASKEAALDRILGTTEWREAFYAEVPQRDLFDMPEIRRDKDIRDLERFVRLRLESIFPLVQEPVRLPKAGSQLYSLFFAMSNSSRTAQALASRISKHIIRNA